MTKKLWNKDFILLLQGSTVSMIGDLMYSVAIGYWVYQKTGSSSLMGIMSSISMFVTMFLSPFAGSIVDKCNRKWVMVGVDLLQSAVMLTIGTLAYMNRLSVFGVLVAALLAAFGSVFYDPAVSTLKIDIIPRDDMVRGQSICSGSSSLISMVGTAFSGVLVAFFGVPLIVVINGLSNLYSAVSELFITVPKTVQQGETVTVKGVFRDYKLAVISIFSDPCLKLFIPFVLILNLLSAGSMTLILPFCMQKGFTVDMYGYLMSVWTAAALLSVLMLSVIKLSPKVRFWSMGVCFCFSEVFLIMAYLSVDMISMCVFVFAGAFMNSIGNSIFNASLMLALPEENRGAILGFVQSMCAGGMALSSVIYGFLGDLFPLYIVFSVGAAITILPMMYVFFHPRVKSFILTH